MRRRYFLLLSILLAQILEDNILGSLFFVSFFSHYFVHGGCLPEEDYLLDNVDAIRHIPATIIQGRYDVTYHSHEDTIGNYIR